MSCHSQILEGGWDQRNDVITCHSKVIQRSRLKSTSGIPAIPNKLILLYPVPNRPKLGAPLEAVPWNINGMSIPKGVLPLELECCQPGKRLLMEPPGVLATGKNLDGKTWRNWEQILKCRTVPFKFPALRGGDYP